MAEIRWTQQALADVDNIAEFIARDSVRYANIQVDRFFEIVKIITGQIRCGRIVPEIQHDSIRELIQGNYRIIYRIVNENQADIITVHHSRRSLHSNPVTSGHL
jgi:toxin ParE1/3/4